MVNSIRRVCLKDLGEQTYWFVTGYDHRNQRISMRQMLFNDSIETLELTVNGRGGNLSLEFLLDCEDVRFVAVNFDGTTDVSDNNEAGRYIPRYEDSSRVGSEHVIDSQTEDRGSWS